MKSMKSPSFLGLACIALLLAPPARAQEPPAEGRVESQGVATLEGDETNALLTTIKASDVAFAAVTDALPAAEGEDLLLLRAQLDRLAAQQHADLMSLLVLVGERDGRDPDVALLYQQAEQLLKRFSRRLRSYVQSFQDDLIQESAARETLAPREAPAFEHRMAINTGRLDRLYLSLVKLTDAMAAVGMSTDSEREFMSQRLPPRGENLLEILELTYTQLDETRQLLRRVPGDPDLQATVFATEERYDSNKTGLLTTIHMMKVLGMDYTEIEVRTLAVTGEITPEALAPEVAISLVEKWIADVKTYAIESFPWLLLRLVVVVGMLVAFWMLAHLTHWVVNKALGHSRISTSTLLKEMVASLAGRVALLIGVIVVLSQVGIDLGPLLAGVGIAGLAIGFALQDTLSNFASGAMIAAYRPYDVGDLVEVAGVKGRVRDMNLVSTRILTVDHQTLIVPNSKIWGDVILNVTAEPRRRIDMVFGISYQDEISEAERVLEEIVDGHDQVLDYPEPVIKLHALNDSSVDFVVRPWVKTEDYWDVYWDITREVKIRFDSEGISIPFPQRDVHLISQTGGSGDSAPISME